LPVSWYTEIGNSVDAVDQHGGHDNLTVNGKDHIAHGSSDDTEYKLETLDLLEEEHVEWHGLTSFVQALWSLQMLELFVDLNLDEVWWKKFDQFSLKLVLDLIFEGFTRSTG